VEQSGHYHLVYLEEIVNTYSLNVTTTLISARILGLGCFISWRSVLLVEETGVRENRKLLTNFIT
jgi:hypothetical protein